VNAFGARAFGHIFRESAESSARLSSAIRWAWLARKLMRECIPLGETNCMRVRRISQR